MAQRAQSSAFGEKQAKTQEPQLRNGFNIKQSEDKAAQLAEIRLVIDVYGKVATLKCP